MNNVFPCLVDCPMSICTRILAGYGLGLGPVGSKFKGYPEAPK